MGNKGFYVYQLRKSDMILTYGVRRVRDRPKRTSMGKIKKGRGDAEF